MTTPSPTIYLKNYQVPAFLIETVDLLFNLGETETRVTSTLQVVRNKAFPDPKAPLILNGDELILKSIHLNDQKLSEKDYQLTKEPSETLTIPNVPDQFSLKIETEIHPEKNLALSGLYRSGPLFCTQCEAEGFRRITFYPDRPDVLAKFTTTIEADKRKYPVLLSNGNCVAKGDKDKHRHWVKWEDPFKKPCYLFALVAGDLIALEDNFVTKNNRLVNIKLFVEPENQDKCMHALNAVKKAMKWDEDTYGREYDLDIYMIVAVNDFNMGAMENKGLNIFNASYILARPETATDSDYENIDAVVGHEYFHNWTGNRITCRDWFQLSLKEGLTVFREHQFMKDITQSPVSLIENAGYLRTAQFAEDSGPMAHSVRPEEYVEINNFYTTTIYEKGAEVIRMIQTLIGDEAFRKGMDIYFEKYDGQAVTVDEFVASMEAASSQDLTQFKLWYSQAGTPEIEAKSDFDPKTKTYSLTLKQFCPKTPGQPHKLPMHIPVAIGLLSKEGKDLLPKKTEVVSLKKTEETFQFPNIAEKPVLSLLRRFSAPVKLKTQISDEELAFLLAKDSDDYNRWDAGQKLTENMVFRLVEDHQNHKPLKLDPNWLEAHLAVLKNNALNPALKSEILTFPSLQYLVELKQPADLDALFSVKLFIKKEFVKAAKEGLLEGYEKHQLAGAYQYTPKDVAFRTFKNLCLGYLMELSGEADSGGLDQKGDPDRIGLELARKQWQKANNMTDTIAVLYAISDKEVPERLQWLEEFYDRWQHNPLVVNKWFRVQASSLLPNTLEAVKQLTQHRAFQMTNPNKVYALIGGFCSGNIYRFNDKSGLGYEFLEKTIKELNALNPQVAARMITPLTRWKQFDLDRQQKMRAQLEILKKMPKLSKDLEEIIDKSLAF